MFEIVLRIVRFFILFVSTKTRNIIIENAILTKIEILIQKITKSPIFIIIGPVLINFSLLIL